MAGTPGQNDAVLALPGPSEHQVYVQVSALNGGFLTLPERLFVTDADPEKRSTVPSMCFLIQHPSREKERSERLVFDLGLKRDLASYVQGMQAHISQRHPIQTLPDVKATLLEGGLDPVSDVDFVLLSHSHWDHIGTPTDFPNSKFVVGSGTLHLYDNGAPHYPSEMFERDLLPRDRTYELPPTASTDTAAAQQMEHKWQPLSAFPNAIDFFNDGSVYVIDTPGHLRGHINLLLRVSAGKWVYLGGDCCHDPRILRGEKGVAEYDDGHGGKRSVHMDLPTAKETLQRIMQFLKTNGDFVEWIVAHDGEWMSNNKHRFFPQTL